MILNIVTEDILKKYGQKIVTGLQKSMQEKGLNASGDTSRSIKYEVTADKFMTALEVTANLALLALETGRGKNVKTTGELRPAIERWVDSKPIKPFDPKMTKKQLVYLIVRKIARDGIKVPNAHNPGGVISDVITDELIDQITREVVKAEAESIVETFKAA